MPRPRLYSDAERLERHRESCRRYREANRQRCREANQRYCDTHRESRRASVNRYNRTETHLEANRQYQTRRRAARTVDDKANGTYENQGRQCVWLPGGSMLLSRYIMEQHLGRILTGDEHVHHVDLNPANDAPDNLVVLTPQEHRQIHALLRKKAKCDSQS